MQENAKGVWAMILACAIWGLSGLFYKLLDHVPPIEVLSHRTVWSCVFFAIVLARQRRLGAWKSLLVDTHTVSRMAVAGGLIAANWFFFIYSIQINQAMQASLGYYIFPLISVLLGILFFGEKLGIWKGMAIILAGTAVAIMVISFGGVPWLALAISLSFGFYGVAKKQLDVGPVMSVASEVLLLLPFAFGVLAVFIWQGQFHFGQDAGTSALLMFSGPLTAGPLMLFSYATKRAALSTIGVLQYINPTLQFLCATLVFAEPFGSVHFVVFMLIWIAVGVYSWPMLRHMFKPA